MAIRYRRALATLFVVEDREAALLEAHDCGREALAANWSLLDLVTLYRSGLAELAQPNGPEIDARKRIEGGEQFLARTLAPFEAARREFAEANAALSQLNEALRRELLTVVREQEIQLARLAEHIQTVADASDSFAEAAVDCATGLDTIARITASTTGASCTVRLLSTDHSHLETAAVYYVQQRQRQAVETALRESSSRLRFGLWRPVIEERRPVRVSAEPNQSGATAKAAEVAFLQDMGISAIVSAPLLARGRVLGEVSVLRFGAATPFTAEDESLVRELAASAALAIDNARLFRDTQAALTRELVAHTATEAALRQRDEFLSVAAHELKTPLTTLRAYSQLTLRGLAADEIQDPARLSRALLGIERESRKLGRLVAQLLDVTRIQAGKLQLECRPTEVVALVHSVVSAADPLRTDHPLNVHAPADVWAEVDSLRLEQVLANLVDNAVKFSPPESPIDITVTRWNPTSLDLTVRDHGTGIAPAKRSLIFDRFYQAHTEDHLSGMGLGLYICRQIIDQHGGTISAEFPPDGGTRIRVRLPLAQRVGAGMRAERAGQSGTAW